METTHTTTFMPRCVPTWEWAVPRPITLDVAHTEQMAMHLKALADPSRLRMVALLAQQREPLCVCDITNQFEQQQPTISHHLRLLREAGFVDCENGEFAPIIGQLRQERMRIRWFGSLDDHATFFTIIHRHPSMNWGKHDLPMRDAAGTCRGRAFNP